MITIRCRLFVACLIAVGTLCPMPQTAAAASGEDGWKPLFDGKTLDGWYVFLKDQGAKNQDTNHLVQVADGAVHMYKDAAADSTQPFGYIATEKEYTSYHLRLQYKWGEKRFAPRNRPNQRRDAGLLYHSGKDKVWPDSVECQIQENDVGDIFAVSTRVTATVDPKTTQSTLSTNRTTGVVRTNTQPMFLPASEGGVPFVQGEVGPSLRIVRNPQNEQPGWNTVEIVVHGDSAVHIVNGKTNNACTKIQQWSGDHWVPLTKGRIALQLEGAEVLYRNIEIKELP